MPRTKGSKNRPKTTNNSVSKADYTTQITEKQSEITTLNSEIEVTLKAIEENKNKAREEAKNAEAESVFKKLLASGMSEDEIIEK